MRYCDLDLKMKCHGPGYAAHLSTSALSAFSPLDHPSANDVTVLVHCLGYGLFLSSNDSSRGWKHQFLSQLPLCKASVGSHQEVWVINLQCMVGRIQDYSQAMQVTRVILG